MLKLYGVSDTILEHEVKTFVFKGGEVQVKIIPAPPDRNWSQYSHHRFRIRATIKSSDDIMGLLLLTDAVRRQFGRFPIELELPYIPYARQDRVCAPGEALSMRVFADMINAQGYDLVRVWDPHSDVAVALINNCEVIKGYQFARGILKHYKDPIDNLVLVSPDAGANKKIIEAAHYMRIGHVIRADKTRNPLNGEITGTVVFSEHVGDKDFIIFDDICDGGRTFVELAKVLRPLTNGKIFLYVTHGIFSYGFDELRKYIDQIYTANSFVDLKEVSDFVKQVDL
jgi:ribose-phosphate pyrophosphokinase